jgi:uncharacterized membrane protein
MNKIHISISIGLFAISLIAAIVLYPTLPDFVPIHWDINGNVDNFGEKVWATFLMPGLMIAMLGLFLLLPKIDPKKFEVLNFRKTYGFLAVLLTGLLTYIHGFMLWGASNEVVATSKWLVVGILIFIAALGNVLGKTRRNFWIGIRTPWTLADERVWNETHRFGGRALMAGGVLGIFSILLNLPMWSALVWVGIAAISAILFSLIRYKQLERDGELSTKSE